MPSERIRSELFAFVMPGGGGSGESEDHECRVQVAPGSRTGTCGSVTDMTSRTERILIVDGDTRAQESLAGHLREKGFLVDTVASVEEAVPALKALAPAVIFADLDVAGIRELASHNRLDEELEVGIPIVCFSDIDSVEQMIDILRAGASDFVVKPPRKPENIDSVLSRLLAQVRVSRMNQVYRQELEATNRDLRSGITELRSDQSAGRKVQMRMLPEHQRAIGPLVFDHLIKPSLYLSGDFLDYFRLDDTRSLVYIADVSGHGASSAFVTVLLKNLTNRLQRNLRRGSSDDILYPERFLNRVNNELLETGLGKHLTLFVGLLDFERKVLRYAVGAHFPMPIISGGGETRFLEGSGLPVGLFEDPTWDIYEVPLPKDFNLVLFSDGILEVIDAPNLDGKEARLLELVSQGGHTIASLRGMLDLDDINELPDDIAIVTVTDMAVT